MVGADGIKSIIRKSVMDGIPRAMDKIHDTKKAGQEGEENLSFSGTKVYRAMIPMDGLKKARMRLDIDPYAINIYLGEHKVLCASTYFASNDSSSLSSIWSRSRLMPGNL